MSVQKFGERNQSMAGNVNMHMHIKFSFKGTYNKNILIINEHWNK